MRYSLFLGLASLGAAGLQFLLKRPVHLDDSSPAGILLRKQQVLQAAASGEPPMPLITVKPAEAQADTAEREKLVARTAYFLAKQRGFVPGREKEDWAVAEAMVAGGTAAKA